jgi:hypothetical protein
VISSGRRERRLAGIRVCFIQRSVAMNDEFQDGWCSSSVVSAVMGSGEAVSPCGLSPSKRSEDGSSDAARMRIPVSPRSLHGHSNCWVLRIWGSQWTERWLFLRRRRRWSASGWSTVGWWTSQTRPRTDGLASKWAHFGLIDWWHAVVVVATRAAACRLEYASTEGWRGRCVTTSTSRGRREREMPSRGGRSAPPTASVWRVGWAATDAVRCPTLERPARRNAWSD